MDRLNALVLSFLVSPGADFWRTPRRAKLNEIDGGLSQAFARLGRTNANVYGDIFKHVLSLHLAARS
jgi:hypothetical protein